MDTLSIPYGYGMHTLSIPYAYHIGEIEIKIEKEIDEKIKLKADEDERGKEHRFASACVYAPKLA